LRPVINPAVALVCFFPLAACQCGQKGDTGQSCWRSLVISEIMYEPAAASAVDGEYFEVHNPSTSACDMAGMTISRGEGESHTIEEGTTVAAGGYAVLAKGEALREFITVDYVYGSTISLTDETELCLNDGDLALDCVSYDASWDLPAAGHSLSLDPEHLDAAENDDPESWCESGEDLGNGDCGSPGEDGLSCTPSAPPACWEELVISEIMHDPSALSDGEGEYIEVHNGSDASCSLLGVEISRTDSGSHVVAEELSVAAGSFVVLAKDEALGTVVPVDYVYGSSITLTAETEICLLSSDGAELDCVAYGGSDWDMPSSGASLSLDPEFLNAGDNDDPGSWCPSSEDLGNGDLGSPGEDGLSCTPPPAPACWDELVISEIMHDPSALSDGEGEYIEVHNGSDASCSLLGVEISRTDSGSHVVAEDLSVAAGSFVVLARDEALGTVVPVDYVYGSGIKLTAETEICLLDSDGAVLDCVDYGGSDWDMPSSGTSLSLDPELLDASDNDDPGSWCPSGEDLGNGDLGSPGSANEACPEHPSLSQADAFFTELMPSPRSDLGAAHGEYAEVFNDAGVDIPLAYLQLEDAGSVKTLTCTGSTWAAGAVLVIARDADSGTNGGIPADCDASFSMADDGDSFALIYVQPDGDELELDALTYSDSWPFSSGVAMELLSGDCFSASGNDESACWASATSIFGTAGHYGTPGTVP